MRDILLSQYTLLFKRGTECYLFNAQSLLTATIPADVYKILKSGEFDRLPDEHLKTLLCHKVLIKKGDEDNYYNDQLIKFNANLGKIAQKSFTNIY